MLQSTSCAGWVNRKSTEGSLRSKRVWPYVEVASETVTKSSVKCYGVKGLSLFCVQALVS